MSAKQFYDRKEIFKMNDITKKIIAVAAVACMAFSSVTACSDKNSSSSSKNDDTSAFDSEYEVIKNEDNNVVGLPFQTGKSGDGNPFASDSGDVDLNEDDPVADTTSANNSGNAATTTSIVTVTDSNGETVTDAQGEPVTEIVTSPANSDNNSGNNNNNNNNTNNGGSNNGGNSNTVTTTPSAEDYVSSTDKMYCLWMDISKDEPFYFEGEFIKITFKLKDNIPERDYPVRINPDFSSIAGQTITADQVGQGTIRVGSDIEAQDFSSATGFVTYADNVSAKPGETIDYYINIKNNPGLAAFIVWFYYDANAMDVVSVTSAGEFEDIASKPQTGTSPAANAN